MNEIRCPICNRLLMKGRVEEVSIKCPKCKNIVRLGRSGFQRDAQAG